MYEYGCHEGNHDIRHILEINRNLERMAAEGRSLRRRMVQTPQGAHGARLGGSGAGAMGSPQADAGGLGRSPIWRRPIEARKAD